MEIENLKHQIRLSMSEKRYKHTIGVLETAVRLAGFYGADREKAGTAALLHDIARDVDTGELLRLSETFGVNADEIEKAVPDLLHGKVGAAIARKQFMVENDEVLNAIRFHTTGRRGMTVLEKIIFIADMIEPGRDFSGVKDLRDLAFIDLDRAIVAGIESTLCYILDRRLPIHPASIEARNFLLLITS